MPIAGIDFGRKRIGLAISDGRGAYPIGIIERRSLKHDLEAIRSRMADRHVSLIVVGLPLNMDGTEGPSARAARAFAERVGAATGLPVEMFDERLTSFEARDRLEDLPVGKGKRKTGIDALAAVVILEGWMQAHGDKIPPAPS